MTLQRLVDAMPQFGNREAVGFANELGLRWWSYKRLHREAWRAAGFLRDHGIGRGDRFVLWAPNSPEWVAVLLGAMLRGAVPVVLDSESSPATVAEVVAAERCRLVLHEGLAGPHAFVGAGVDACPMGAPFRGTGAAAQESVRLPCEENDPAVFLYSSGTVGQPKGVLLSHRNLTSQVEPFLFWRRVVRWTPFSVRMLALPPTSHVLGLVVGLALPLSIGLSVVYTSRAAVSEWSRIIRDYQVMIGVVVPQVLLVLRRHVLETPFGGRRESASQRMSRGGKVAGLLWPIWARGELLGRQFRLVLAGGAHLAPSLARFWHRSGVLVVQGYGLAETAAFVTISRPHVAGNVGRAVGAQEVRIAPDGEILVRGPNVAHHGGQADADERFTSDGFLRTGDIGRLDVHGRLEIIGRRKEIIVTREGFSVFPNEVEVACLRQPRVIETAVVGYGEGGDEIHAVLRVEAKADPASIVRAANSELQPHQRIRSWTLWSPAAELPRNRMGKVDRALVVERLRRLAFETPAPRSTVLFADILSCSSGRDRIELLARYLTQEPRGHDGEDVQLVDGLGLSSLDVVELTALLEQRGDQAERRLYVGRDATIGDLREQLKHPTRPMALLAGAVGRGDGGVPIRRSPWSLPLVALRPITSRLVFPMGSFLCARVETHFACDPLALEPPLIIAAIPHEGSGDALIIHRALPPRLRRRLHLLIDGDFRPPPRTPWRERWRIALGYYVVLPLFCSFTALTRFGRTRDSLLDAAKQMDRGASPLSFPTPGDLGIVRIAIATGRSILPAYIERRRDTGVGVRRSHVRVHFDSPLVPTADAQPADLASTLWKRFATLRARASGSCGTEEGEPKI
jgi:long-chain acyl-CoA synthetase